MSPSPMLAPRKKSTQHTTPDEPVTVEVWVDVDIDQPTWCPGVLAEWTHYEQHGWTGWVRYATAPGQNRIGRFHAEHIRRADQEGQASD